MRLERVCGMRQQVLWAIPAFPPERDQECAGGVFSNRVLRRAEGPGEGRDDRMADSVIGAIFRRVEEEPYARKLGMRLLELEPGRAVVEMIPGEGMENIFGMAHGGAIFSLIDEAFQVSCNAHGTVAVALSMTLTYHASPKWGRPLRAESREIHRSRKTGTYEIKVTDDRGALLASCQALAYRKGSVLPFLNENEAKAVESRDRISNRAEIKEGA